MSDTISEQPSKLKAALATPTTSHHPSKKEKKESSGNNKEKKSDSESSRKRSSSGGGKRGVTPGGSKRGSTLGASAGEPTIKVAPIPEEPTADPGTPTFGGGEFLTAIFALAKGPIFSEKYWYYFHCPKNVLRSILCFAF